MHPRQNPHDQIDSRAGSLDDLSPRELEILRLITNGLSNPEIASTAYLGINTVKTYTRTSYRKIGVATRTQAVLWGVHHGLLDGFAVVQEPSDDAVTLRAV